MHNLTRGKTTWLEKNQTTQQITNADEKRAQDLEGEKGVSLPVIAKESERGTTLFNEIKFQPVIGTGIFEGEFAVKGNDVIFHFWPHGYHVADSSNRPVPAFKPGFKEALKSAAEKAFGKNRIEMKDDRDIGALFLRAIGWADSQFHRQVSITMCESLFKALGGEG